MDLNDDMGKKSVNGGLRSGLQYHTQTDIKAKNQLIA
jgi:hypothetical protein